MVYLVKTKERTYNYVESPQHFRKIRTLWKDYSKVVEAFRWSPTEGRWIPAGKKQFEYRYKRKRRR